MVCTVKEAARVWVGLEVYDLGVVGTPNVYEGACVVVYGWAFQGWRAWHMSVGLRAI